MNSHVSTVKLLFGPSLEAGVAASHPYKLHGFIIETHVSVTLSDVLINYNEPGEEVNFGSLPLPKVLPGKYS